MYKKFLKLSKINIKWITVAETPEFLKEEITLLTNKTVIDKKFELMLTRCAKAYSSSGSVV